MLAIWFASSLSHVAAQRQKDHPLLVYASTAYNAIKRNWHPKAKRSFVIKVEFTVQQTGAISDVRVVESNATPQEEALAKAALASTKLPPLPPGSPSSVSMEYCFRADVQADDAGSAGGAEPAAGSTETVNGSTGGATAPDVVPYVVSPSGQMLVVLQVNGKPIQVCFDTGADVCYLTTSQLAAAGIKLPTRKTDASFADFGGKESILQAEARLSLGTVNRLVTVYVRDDSRDATRGRVRMKYPLLGRNFWQLTPFRVDDRAKTITFISDRDAPIAGCPVPFTIDGYSMAVTATVNGRPLKMILDTGASTVTVSEKHLQTIGVKPAQLKRRSADVHVGGRESVYRFDIEKISLGPVTKLSVPATCGHSSFFDKPLLGRSFLRGVTYTVDSKNKRIYIEGCTSADGASN